MFSLRPSIGLGNERSPCPIYRFQPAFHHEALDHVQAGMAQ